MTEVSLDLPRREALDLRGFAPKVIGGIAFVVLFWGPFGSLVTDWATDPDSGHGLLLAPLALYLAWKRGIAAGVRPQPVVGTALLALAVALRYLAGLAAEHFSMRASLLGALIAFVIMAYGWRQLLHWWLPLGLLILSIPLPTVVLGSLALPLQLEASRMGAAMLEWRHVPVQLSGNVINLPGRSLFVTEACSGLRSLSALIALGLLVAGLWLRTPLFRLLLVAAAIPVAMVLNGVRIFITGFLVYFVDPRLGEGVMHYTEGWMLFVVAFLVLGFLSWAMTRVESLWRPGR